MGKTGGYEVTLLLQADATQRLDALAERGMTLRRSMGLPVGHIGIRDVLHQAIEIGLESMERSVTQAETRDRKVLTPKEWAAQLGSGPRGGGLVVAR